MMTKRFIIGFGVGFLFLLALNLVAAHLASDCGLSAVFGRDACADEIARAGWPLPFYEEGGFAYRYHFNSLFLWIDLGIGLAFAFLSGWVLSRDKKTPLK
jgi:ABC-type antimicrobial peptide transport system permease subunit